MKRILALLLALPLFSFAAPNEKLVAEWDFSRNATSSTDGKFGPGVLRGNSIVEDGWLDVRPMEEDKASGYQVHAKNNYPELSPKGGFRLEVVAKLNKDITRRASQMFFDNKYLFANGPDASSATHHGFAFGLIRNSDGRYSLQAWLGFDGKSQNIRAKALEISREAEHVFALEYNGANRVRFFVDGKCTYISTFTPSGDLMPALRAAIIGDRVGSTYNSFNGKIRSVRLYSFPAQTLILCNYGRLAFVRNEKDAAMEFQILNVGKETIHSLKASTQFQKSMAKASSLPLTPNSLAPGESRIIRIPLDSNRWPGSYPIRIIVEGTSDAGMVQDGDLFDLRIGPQLVPDNMPVLMWGGHSIEVIRDSGFTHDLGGFAESVRTSTDLEATRRNAFDTLDNYIAGGLRRASYFTLAHAKALKEQFPRTNRDGNKTYTNIEASNPEYQKLITDVAAKTAAMLAPHPAVDAMLINSEVRDSTSPSFTPCEAGEFEKFAGYPVPEEIHSKSGVNYSRVKDFPFSRIIPDNHPILTYYRWFWKNGDGWNTVHSKVSEEYHKAIRRPYWTFFDPAVRVPPVWGSGGSVDFLSHWTYAYPDPIRSAASTDELRAMADGRPGQDIMSMTQIICYRSATAPIGKVPENEPAWVKDSPEGPYISIPPDMLRASIWSKISRRVQGIMFHGSGSVWGKPGNKGYVTTNPETKVMLSHVLNDIVKPLGPTLKRIPEREPQVALLHSFASSVFAGRGTMGWSSWLYDAHLMLQWANLSPSVIYEEKIVRDGLGSIQVLCMFHCDVLSESAYKRIAEFQKRGGILVADEFLTPALMPDIVIPSVSRSPKADVGKQQLQDAAHQLRQELAGVYKPYSDASNMDIVTRVRSYKKADYLFVLSDKRTYGDYFGPWGLVMEKGLPNSGTVTLQRSAKAIYDPIAHKEVRFASTKNGITIPQRFDSNEGRLLIVLNQKISKIVCDAPKGALAGAPVELKIRILGDDGKPVPALLPIDIRVTSPQGMQLDGCGAACAVDGQHSFTFTTPAHQAEGNWNIQVTDLASGKKITRNLTIKHP